MISTIKCWCGGEYHRQGREWICKGGKPAAAVHYPWDPARMEPVEFPVGLRLFQLVRDVDISGVSGTGIVGVGAEYPTGKCVMEWTVSGHSMSIYDSEEILISIHGHDGSTRLVWLDD